MRLEKRLWRSVLPQKLRVLLVNLLLIEDLYGFRNIGLLVVWAAFLYYILDLPQGHRGTDSRCVVSQSWGTPHTHQVLLHLFNLVFSHLNFVRRTNSLTHFDFLVLGIIDYAVHFIPLLSCR